METAIGVFSKSDESEKLPFLAVELCRERIVSLRADLSMNLWSRKNAVIQTMFYVLVSLLLSSLH